MNNSGFIVAVVAAALVLAGCGAQNQGATAQLFRGAASLIQSGKRTAPPGPDDLLTRDVIDTVTVPYAMVGIERRGAYASMTLAGQNGPYNSWVTSDGAGIVLRGDVLTGTKGLGADLMTADVGDFSTALQGAGPASVERVHGFLNGEGRLFTITYRCTLQETGLETITIIGRNHSTRVVAETCLSDKGSFENRYWVGRDDGIMWQSRQWVSDEVGSIIVLGLVPIGS